MGEDKEQFIDVESSYSKERNTFQDILNRQIRKTADILSCELTSGIFEDAKTKVRYEEDRREVAINHVRTTRTLMLPFIKKVFDDDLKECDKEFKDFKKELGKTEIMMYGVGKVLASETLHDKKSLTYAKLIDFKVEVYRKIFEVLIMAYHKNKQEIREFSQE